MKYFFLYMIEKFKTQKVIIKHKILLLKVSWLAFEIIFFVKFHPTLRLSLARTYLGGIIQSGKYMSDLMDLYPRIIYSLSFRLANFLLKKAFDILKIRNRENDDFL